MLSNTSATYKLKASKSSRDLHNFQFNHNDENFDNDSYVDGPINDTNRRQSIYTSRDGRFKGTRSRQTEFKHGRMGAPFERRGYSRGRGGSNATTYRRDRDFSDANNSYSHTKKYHDTLNRSSESGGMLYRSKCYEPEKKTVIKFNLPEDIRISKLLRRLSMESDPENSLTISKKLLEVLLIPENAHYVRKAFHILGDSMLDILRVAPGKVAKKEAAKALGRMGYIMGQENDFVRFQDWMFTRMANETDDTRYLFMKALKETLIFEVKKRVLQEHIDNLISDLVSVIELAENAMLFKCTLDVLINVVELYPEEFYPHFRDAVDLFLGWHVDLTQPLSNIEFISENMQRIRSHFQNNLEFSKTLVYHFFEDIDSNAKEFEKDKKNFNSISLNNMTIYVLSLNTILKCLEDTLKLTNSESVNVKFVTNSLTQIVNTLINALNVCCIHDNLIIAINENIALLLNILPTKTNTLNSSIYLLISLEINSIDKFEDSTTISMLLMISKVLKELSANLPSDLVEKLVGPTSKIIQLRYSPFVKVQEATIHVYQALLNLKNIPLLQEAYRCILGDLEMVIKQIVPNVSSLCPTNPFESSDYVCHDVELSALFLLRSLSQLANASSSIIGMWALKPSVLELLAVLLEPQCEELRVKAPFLQYGLFYLLYSHCKCYNYFIASSSLVNSKSESGNRIGLLNLSDDVVLGDITGKSPNSENFTLILNIIYKSLNTLTSCKTTLLLLHWINDILDYSEPYLTMLYNSSHFQEISNVLIKCGYNNDSEIVLSVSSNLDKLLSKKELPWINSFLISINELCIFHMNSNNRKIRQSYTSLSQNIPWDLTVLQFNNCYSVKEAKLKCHDLESFDNHSVALAQHLHVSGVVYGEILPLHFVTFMEYLLHGQEKNQNWLEDIFVCCWPLESDVPHLSKNMEGFRNLALNNRAVLNNWITYEAAQLCVNLKLRTPLGKPNETFTSFEAFLKQLAKDVMKPKNNAEDYKNVLKIDQGRVRLLLQFMEHLEKAIYNASEGCAIAMLPPSKPVRTFFHTNASTCKEWLARIRIVIVHVALHAGQSTVALRHGQALLKNLVTTNKTQTVDFERTVMYVTLALLNLKENEAIYGLYAWCKKIANKKFEWVKCASDQANKKYEIAAKQYKLILENANDEHLENSSETKSNAGETIDAQVKYFISNQIINCYKELNSWKDVLEWQSHNFSYGQSENGLKYSFTTLNKNCVKALSDTESLFALNKLSSWTTIKVKHCDSVWSSYDILERTESNLYNIALNKDSYKSDVALSKIDKILKVIRKGMQDNLLTLPSEFLPTFCLDHYIANGLKTILNHSLPSNVFLVSENFESNIEKMDSTFLSKILWWSEYFSRDYQSLGFNPFINSLRLHIIRKARKEKNHNLATLHINKFLVQNEAFKIEFDNQNMSITGIGNALLQNSAQLSNCSIEFAKAVKESIKLLYATEEKKHLVFNLCASASKAIYKNAEIHCNQDMQQIGSKILLKLSTWLQINESSISLTDMSSPLVKMIMVLPEIGMIENLTSNIIPQNELAAGKLLQFSVHKCINLAKNWFAFGTWCYRWGRKIINNNCNITNCITEEDKIEIRECLPINVTEDDFTKVLNVLSLKSDNTEDDINTNMSCTVETIQEELKEFLVAYGIHETQLQALLQIWKKSQKRMYSYYELSADAYFQYLQLATNAEIVNNSAECNTITATLRLLHLIVKYALELKIVLDNGLASTPTQPWKVIIPQLFSHLNHPEAYVRQRVSEFLCRVANDAPHLITFPAVVGAVEGGVDFGFGEISMSKDCFSQSNSNGEDNELEEIEDAYESDTDETSHTVLQLCFKSMVDTLSKLAPETITQVQLLVKELRRITLLWDELWLGTLMQYHTEIIQRQHQLEVEIEKVNTNLHLNSDEKISLITEKYRIIMKPIIFILEQLQSVTSIEAETPHEKLFQERYAAIIKEVLEKLKNPDHPEKPQECWQPLKRLQNLFQQKAHKRSMYTLKMEDISPILANMKDTDIAMPGLAISSKTPTTIMSVSSHVSILPTKTKPKKLIFNGSDGQSYPYLFKGLEDLHLDERIMQFLSIANTMMAQGTDSTSLNLYRARHYSVIPLGPRSGLISWVDGTTPVFALYKRWQQREITKTNNRSVSGPKSTSNAAVVLRPSELFYNKLNPLLQEHGVKNIENRKEWPLAILKQVLGELMKETPNDLLAKELWCNSINAGEWLQVIRNYAYSVAVMSTLGYIIGLGDRHLDNMLVDLSSGEVVHIDYNVCFEKGKTLRVPEKVPFRLTPNILEALGVTGVEGIFRLACENVLKTMRRGRETLLTLLEAFVYDPLVDWTVGGEGLAGTAFRGVAGTSLTRQSRKDLEKEVTLSMYNVRCTEMKIDLITNRDDILGEIPNGLDKLRNWLNKYEKVSETEDVLQDLHRQMTIIKEAEANDKHLVHSLPMRFDAYTKKRDMINVAIKDLELFVTDVDVHTKAYAEALKVLDTHQYSQWIMDLKTSIDQENNHVFDLVDEFLQKAKSTLIALCQQSENDVEHYRKQQAIVTTKCLHLLQDYSNIYIQFPPNYRENHRTIHFTSWSKLLLENGNNSTWETIYTQLCNFSDLLKVNNAPQATTIELAYRLNLLLSETSVLASQIIDEMNQSKEANDHVDTVYNNAKLAMTSFLRCEKSGFKALKFIILNELCKQNKEQFAAEVNISRNKSYTLKVPAPKGGEWFLDHLTSYSNNTLEYLSYLLLNQTSQVEDPMFVKCINATQAVNNVYKSLQELYSSFHTIILPESMKKVFYEEPTVVQMIGELNNLVRSVGISLPELIIQLEKQLACVVMQMEVDASHLYVNELLSELKMRYQLMIHSQTENLSQGKMLLMGFNGLFDKLNVEFQNLINSFVEMEIPLCWRKVDQVKQARNLSASIFNVQIMEILNDIFLIKRIQTMIDFFTISFEMTNSFKNPAVVKIFNDEQLDKPVKTFITDFITRQFLGISSEAVAYTVCTLLQSLGLNVTSEIEQKDIGAEHKVSLNDLTKKGGTMFLKQNVFSQNALAQASTFQTNLKSSWSVIQNRKQQEQRLVLIESSLMRLQNQMTAYSWLHENILYSSNIMGVNEACSRNAFIVNLQTECNNLNTLINKMTDVREQHKALVVDVNSRLNWAVGANPDVNQVMLAFDSAVGVQENRLKVEQHIAKLVFNTCNSILQHELLRTQSIESDSMDKRFLNVLHKWQGIFNFNSLPLEEVTPVEENIMRLYTQDLSSNPKWVTMISEKLSQVIAATQKDLGEQKENMFILNDSIVMWVEKFRNLIHKHNKLMSEVKTLIKSMIKIEDCSPVVQDFMIVYRQYTENFMPILNCFKKEILQEEVQDVINNLAYLNENTKCVYDSLVNLNTKSEKNQEFRPPLLKQQEVSSIATAASSLKQDGTTKVQQRNAYAMGVWRRVRLKLEGRDPDPAKKITTQEQVDYIIREASSLDNLALMYEGWTPWV